MRAGKLQHRVQIQREYELVADSGLVRKEWLPLISTRADLKQASTGEFLAGAVEMDSNRAVFVIRFPVTAITTADRIAFNGRYYGITGIVEIGRRRGLEIRAVAG